MRTQLVLAALLLAPGALAEIQAPGNVFGENFPVIVSEAQTIQSVKLWYDDQVLHDLANVGSQSVSFNVNASVPGFALIRVEGRLMDNSTFTHRHWIEKITPEQLLPVLPAALALELDSLRESDARIEGEVANASAKAAEAAALQFPTDYARASEVSALILRMAGLEAEMNRVGQNTTDLQSAYAGDAANFNKGLWPAVGIHLVLAGVTIFLVMRATNQLKGDTDKDTEDPGAGGAGPPVAVPTAPPTPPGPVTSVAEPPTAGHPPGAQITPLQDAPAAPQANGVQAEV